MAVTAYAQPKFFQLDPAAGISKSYTWVMGLSTGAMTARGTAQGWEFLGDLTAANPELNTGGYTAVTSRITATITTSTSALVMTLTTATSISWTSQTWSTVTVAWLACKGSGGALADAAAPLLCYWDLGGAQSVTAGTFTLTVPGGGLCTVTAAQ